MSDYFTIDNLSLLVHWHTMAWNSRSSAQSRVRYQL